MTSQILDEISEKIKNSGFDHFGFTPLTRPLSFDLYRDWINDGHHGAMTYLENHLELKESPQKLEPQAKSAIVIALPYAPTHPAETPLPVRHLKIARYARGLDYHHFFQRKLNALCQALAQVYSAEVFRAFTDAQPVLERDLAYRAGLGWFGKNSCLIDPKRGSFFLIGEIYTSLELSPNNALSHDFCGSCRRCIDACPTQAIQDNRTLIATRCISYLNIELKAPPPETLRSKMGDWFFGCDICQDVCPWNQKIIKDPVETPSKQGIIEDLRFILSQSNKALERIFKGTPLLRRGGLGLKKNAILVAVNVGASDLLPEIARSAKNHQSLTDLCRWAESQLLNSSV